MTEAELEKLKRRIRLIEVFYPKFNKKQMEIYKTITTLFLDLIIENDD